MQQLPLDLQIRSTESMVISSSAIVTALPPNGLIAGRIGWASSVRSISPGQRQAVNRIWQLSGRQKVARYCLVILMTILQVSVMRCISSSTLAEFRWPKRDCFISSTIRVTLVDHC